MHLTRRFATTVAAFGAVLGLSGGAAHADTVETVDLAKLSIEELGDIQVTSVSKRAEPVGQAASAIYVITNDDIARSGAETLPEILRLAPNLEVAQTGAARYQIAARGLNGNPAAQNFSNKLLVLIDGRSVYTPLFSGVYWEAQDVLPQDIDRIEVISGPGATLWGANAVNGVINITTRKSSETQGGLLELGAGNRQQTASLRYGGRITPSLTYRVYARTIAQKDSEDAKGHSEHDHWSRPQAGFRMDWEPSADDTVTLQGDAYAAKIAQPATRALDVSGGNVLGRWTHAWSDGANLQVQAYYDRARRGAELNGLPLVVHTYDLDVQDSFRLGDRQEIVLGGGLRSSRYRIYSSPTFRFVPDSRNLPLSNLFAQDTITLTRTARLTLGAKLEDDPYVAPELLPTARLSWTPTNQLSLWTAVSRAVRSPTPLDRDVLEIIGGSPFLVGSSNFTTEKLVAYETGARTQLSARLAVTVSAYYNHYDDLRSIELTPVTVLPLHWGNRMTGNTYGVEAWGDFQATPWWRLSAGLSAMDGKFKFKPGSSKLGGLQQAGDDPKYQASMKSSMYFGPFTADADLRYVSAHPNPRVPQYAELNGRLGWNITDRVQLSLAGYNLLRERHLEYPQGTYIPRSVFADIQLRF